MSYNSLLFLSQLDLLVNADQNFANDFKSISDMRARTSAKTVVRWGYFFTAGRLIYNGEL